LLVVVALSGCRGFFDVPPVSPDATAQPDGPSVPVGYVQSAANTVTAGNSVTASFPLAQQMYIHLGVFEYTGIAGVDTSTGTVGTASDSPHSGEVTTTNAHDLLFAALTSIPIRRGYRRPTTNASTQADWVMQLLALKAQ